MNRLLFAAVWLAFSLVAQAGAFTSTTSGNFADGTTWVGGVAPSTAGDTWTIAAGHDVVYNMDNSAGAGWGASVVTGKLVMTNTGTQAFLKMQGDLSGAGNWRIGSSNTPITFVSTNLPAVVIEFTGSAKCSMAGTNNLGWYGDSSHVFTTYLSNACGNADTSIVLSNVPPNVTTNDVIWVGNSNTVGQAAAEYYVVGSVSGTTITFMQTPLGTATNHWPGIAFRTSTSSARPAGSAVAFLSQPIVVRDAARNVSLFTASKTNTINGVLLQNLGRGFTSACPGWTAYGNTINNCVNGFAYNSASWTVYGNTINNGSGGLANNSSGWTVYSNVVNNVSSGGLGSTCTRWVVYENTVNNTSYGGLGYSCVDWTVHNNWINNCTSGGLAYNCSNWVAYSNVVNNCTVGGLGYSSCYTWVVYKNTIINCASGSLANLSCGGWNAYANTVINSAPLFVFCGSSKAFNNSIGYTSDTLTTVPDSCAGLQFDSTFWLGNFGTVTKTNLLGVTGDFIHSITTTNQPVAYNIPVSVRPFGSRIVSIFAYQTNGVSYYAEVVPGGMGTVSYAALVAPAAASGGWTNFNFTLTNTNNTDVSYEIWVSGTGTAANSKGYSYVNVAGKDSISVKQ